MSIKDKKEEILQILNSTNDEQLIEEVYELLNPNAIIEEIQLNKLSPQLQNKINRALDDYKKGLYITHEQMKQKVEQWLTS
ncbi:MAG TPA: hypothetical protein VIJ95_12705 [Hanamia sp.]